MMENVQKPSNSVCYTPSSDPFRIYLYSMCCGNEGTSSPVSDVDRYIIIRNVLDCTFSVLPVFTLRCDIKAYLYWTFNFR
jgi:hypothetical protein